MKRNKVTVIVPASTSNLGSGFDTLGLAVRLYNVVTVRRSDQPGLTLSRQFEPAHAMAAEAATAFFERTRTTPFGVHVACKSPIPIARGLGFSSTLRVGILAGLNDLARTRWTREQLLAAATDLEGHPDNASPAVFGGFTVSARVNGDVECFHFPVSSRVSLVTLIPDFGIRTELARELMPQQFTKADAAHALNRTANITAAFARQDYAGLRGLFDDRFHQPYRQKLIPQLLRIINAGVQAGAIGGWLSGSGSAIMCLTLKRAKTVAGVMKRELPGSSVLLLKPENHGYRIQ